MRLAANQCLAKWYLQAWYQTVITAVSCQIVDLLLAVVALIGGIHFTSSDGQQGCASGVPEEAHTGSLQKPCKLCLCLAIHLVHVQRHNRDELRHFVPPLTTQPIQELAPYRDKPQHATYQCVLCMLDRHLLQTSLVALCNTGILWSVLQLRCTDNMPSRITDQRITYSEEASPCKWCWHVLGLAQGGCIPDPHKPWSAFDLWHPCCQPQSSPCRTGGQPKASNIFQKQLVLYTCRVTLKLVKSAWQAQACSTST